MKVKMFVITIKDYCDTIDKIGIQRGVTNYFDNDTDNYSIKVSCLKTVLHKIVKGKVK